MNPIGSAWVRRIFWIAGWGALAFSLLLFSGCGGGGASFSSQNPNPQPNTTQILVNLGDAPSDRLVAVSMSIDSMTLTGSGGGNVTVVSTSTPVEMMHLMGTVEPISLMAVPQQSYSGMTASISSVVVMYMDPVSGQLVQKAISGGTTAAVSFNPAMTVGTSPMVLNFDMNMASSVSIDNSGNVTMTPTMTASMNSCCSGNPRDPEDGRMQHMTGTVASFSGNSFMLSMIQSSQNVQIVTGSNTQFEGMGGMGGMANGMIIMVDCALQADGTLMAQKVQSVMGMSGSSMGGGLITDLTGSPVTQLTIAMMDGAGSGMMGSNLAGTITVNVSPTATFSIDSDGMDMSNLPFTPSFDGSSVIKGQRVAAVSSSGMMPGGGMGGMMGGGTINASEIDLEQQGLSGTVLGASGAAAPTTFTLMLASDSAFTTMTGATAVTVFQQAGAEMRGMSALSNGSTVHVRGLLFFDAGMYKMVAARIVAAQP